MGKLVLTRRAGESVKLTEPNGRNFLLTVVRFYSHVFQEPHKVRIRIAPEGLRASEQPLGFGDAISFAGGNVELRPHKRPDQAILAFDFPRDVTIVRTEIA